MSQNSGANRGNARFTDEMVLDLRRKGLGAEDGRAFIRALAAETGACTITVRNLLIGRSYCHVPEALTHAQLGIDPHQSNPAMTDEQVVDVRARYAAAEGKLTMAMLRQELGMAPERIRKMLLGISYSHVPGALPRVLEIRARRKWTDEQMREMRLRYPEPGVTLATLAAEYGGDETCIAQALLGRSYSDIPGALDKLKPSGVKHTETRNLPARRLAPEVVLLMRLQYRPKVVTVAMLAATYGLKDDAIREALLGTTYKEVPGALPYLGLKKQRPPNKLILSDERVISLRSEFRTGRRTCRAISKELGVSYGTAKRMLRGKSFQHVPGPVVDGIKAIRKRRTARAVAEAQERERKIAQGIPIRPLIQIRPLRFADHDEGFDQDRAA